VAALAPAKVCAPTLVKRLRPLYTYRLQVVELMAAEKGWGWWRRRKELQRAEAFLKTFTASE
jgi:hypothetical protein